MTVDLNSKPVELSPETVPLGTGLPTREELLVHYPAKFTWHQLKVFVNSGYVHFEHTRVVLVERKPLAET